MGLSDYFKSESKYLRADDLREGAEITLTIDRIQVELIENDNEKKDKAVVYFSNKEKGLVLNATNGKKLVEAYGDDPKSQEGKQVVLYRDTVAFQGQTVPCLRLRIPTVAVDADDIPF